MDGYTEIIDGYTESELEFIEKNSSAIEEGSNAFPFLLKELKSRFGLNRKLFDSYRKLKLLIVYAVMGVKGFSLDAIRKGPSRSAARKEVGQERFTFTLRLSTYTGIIIPEEEVNILKLRGTVKPDKVEEIFIPAMVKELTKILGSSFSHVRDKIMASVVSERRGKGVL